MVERGRTIRSNGCRQSNGRRAASRRQRGQAGAESTIEALAAIPRVGAVLAAIAVSFPKSLAALAVSLPKSAVGGSRCACAPWRMSSSVSKAFVGGWRYAAASWRLGTSVPKSKLGGSRRAAAVRAAQEVGASLHVAVRVVQEVGATLATLGVGPTNVVGAALFIIMASCSVIGKRVQRRAGLDANGKGVGRRE
ncbi:UNVERIFIED_CONTAM: hypothetical protein Sangu_3211800 [Sesamum angustifolium]|uniref:Uncharacterized protein n=1 Tax=Sesamum angustifolium TaxID=2727405 RepID=A0AAW2JJQ7_9LAMI